MGFSPFWDYKPTHAIHADSPGVYTSAKILNLSTVYKIYLKTDVIDESIVNGSRQPILFSFALNKPSGYKVFCEPETIHYKKIKSVVNTITFYIEINDHEEVDFKRNFDI